MRSCTPDSLSRTFLSRTARVSALVALVAFACQATPAGAQSTSTPSSTPTPPPAPTGTPSTGEPVTANQPLLRNPRMMAPAQRATHEVECTVAAGAPCSGRMDFNNGRSFGFRIPGPGLAMFRNIGNRRCTLEYALLDSTIATAGRTMELAAGEETSLKVRDAQGAHVSLTARGMLSPVCELEVSAKSS